MHSSVKYNGKKLYQYARDGIEVARKKKNRYKRHNSVEKNIEDIDIRVRCSKGTYIRTLVEDIGARLGVSSYTEYKKNRSRHIHRR